MASSPRVRDQTVDCLTPGMAEQLSVSVTDLRRALDRVLGEVSQRHGDVITLSVDHYWTLPPGSAYDLTGVPGSSQLTVGQLSDDVEELTGMLDAERDVIPWHDLAHLVAILGRIADQDRG
jgi:hypothetical protein